MYCKIDLETIGFYLYMEEQERAAKEADEIYSPNNNPVSWENEPHNKGNDD